MHNEACTDVSCAEWAPRESFDAAALHSLHKPTKTNLVVVATENQSLQSSFVSSSLGEFVNLTNQFIMYTDSKKDPVSEWVDFVHQLQVARED